MLVGLSKNNTEKIKLKNLVKFSYNLGLEGKNSKAQSKK